MSVDRKWAADQALASTRLAGLEPSAKAKAFMREWVAGTVDDADMLSEIDRLVEQAKERNASST